MWRTSNQRALAAALVRVRVALQRYIARSSGALEDGAERAPIPTPAATPSALETLCATFGLSPFERDALMLCAGVDLDATFAALCAEAQNDPQRVAPTFGLALAALPDPHWSAIAPNGRLRRWRLVELGPGSSLTRSPLRISERVLHYLAGVQHLDERLAGLVDPVHTSGDLVPSQRALADQLLAAWSHAPRARLPIIQLCGDDRSGKRAIAEAACAGLGLKLNVMRADVLPTSPGELMALIYTWEREAALSGSALLLDCDALDPSDTAHTALVVRMAEQLNGAMILACRDRQAILERPTLALYVFKPSTDEQRAAWRSALGPAEAKLNGQLDMLVTQFNLDTQSIRAASAEALERAEHMANGDLGRAIWEACRTRGRVRMDDLAQRIEPAAGWDDLVLPEAQRQILRDVAAHVRQRARVYESWGFAGKGARGLGISALFAGSSGTGKTMAAEVLAGTLHLDLYRIDLSAVVSKYIGETEKNLRRIFDTAEEGGAILLFDEADALFGKRSEVKDSHDRYANIEVSYLLQRMEAYRGLAILTTNLKSALDIAFMRRIRFVIQFPFPDAAQRVEIWRRIFPRNTPTEGLDLERLAQLNVAGGNIRNIALNAAFLAADAGEPVRMHHLLRASRAEYAKLEKSLTNAETAGWVE